MPGCAKISSTKRSCHADHSRALYESEYCFCFPWFLRICLWSPHWREWVRAICRGDAKDGWLPGCRQCSKARGKVKRTRPARAHVSTFMPSNKDQHSTSYRYLIARWRKVFTVGKLLTTKPCLNKMLWKQDGIRVVPFYWKFSQICWTHTAFKQALSLKKA